MKRFRVFTQTFGTAALLLATVGALMLAGCGDLNRSPVGADSEASMQGALETPVGYFVFSQRAAVRAAKKVKVTPENALVKSDHAKIETSQIISKIFKFDKNGQNKQGMLLCRFNKYIEDNSGQVQVKNARFSVQRQSIVIPEEGVEQSGLVDKGTRVDIKMQVLSGTKLEHIQIGFQPGGLEFMPHAKLELSLIGDLADSFEPRQTEGYAFHIEGNGTITRVRMEIEEDGGELKLTIEVPGFSRYGFGGA